MPLASTWAKGSVMGIACAMSFVIGSLFGGVIAPIEYEHTLEEYKHLVEIGLEMRTSYAFTDLNDRVKLIKGVGSGDINSESLAKIRQVWIESLPERIEDAERIKDESYSRSYRDMINDSIIEAKKIINENNNK